MLNLLLGMPIASLSPKAVESGLMLGVVLLLPLLKTGIIGLSSGGASTARNPARLRRNLTAALWTVILFLTPALLYAEYLGLRAPPPVPTISVLEYPPPPSCNPNIKYPTEETNLRISEHFDREPSKSPEF